MHILPIGVFVRRTLRSSMNASLIPGRRYFDLFARFHAASRSGQGALSEAAIAWQSSFRSSRISTA